MAPAAKRRVVVSGIGLVTPCGTGTEPSWSAVVEGRSGIGPITLFDAERLETRIAGEASDFDPLDFMDRKQARRLHRFQQFAMAASEMALADAGYVVSAKDRDRAAVLVGSSVGGLEGAEREHSKVLAKGPSAANPFFILQLLSNMAPAQVAIRFGFKGPNWSTNSACASSAHALGEAMRMIQRGEAVVALAGGAEAPICLMGVSGFGAMRALSTRNDAPDLASRPFDRARDGFVLSEGSAMLFLEDLEHAEARGARILAELAGYGATGDAYHLTAPAPFHEGGQRCMQAALADAGVAPGDVDYINAHATSTPAGDRIELEAMRAVFGSRASGLPISSTKSITGHMTGAAGAAEAAFSILAMDRKVIPPTINLDDLDFDGAMDCVAHTARFAEPRTVMSNSFGFGGTNASLVLRAYERN